MLYAYFKGNSRNDQKKSRLAHKHKTRGLKLVWPIWGYRLKSMDDYKHRILFKIFIPVKLYRMWVKNLLKLSSGPIQEKIP